ncbi:MAG: 3-deoxy-7-phosphoheptulonate synthase class II [Myxococcales bacterium FL481]|nr:MAG: 3-deoxy-7-phosphoheptulonate synthase class II [Myxococcales bacterium FL481]
MITGVRTVSPVDNPVASPRADARGTAAWRPDSWRSRPALQLPKYPEAEALDRVLGKLGTLPPLVTSGEVLTLKEQLAHAAAGKAFVLQGGDCAESFDGCESPRIAALLKVLLQMSLVLVYGLNRPVVRVGRMAGQYAKPRSADLETRNGLTLPSYRGDNVNAPAFTAEARIPDPQRLLSGYYHAAATLNFVRGLIDGGFTDLHQLATWNLGFVEHSELRHEYEKISRSVLDALRFIDSLQHGPADVLSQISMATSHEALHLHYESALTREVPRRSGWFNLSTHMPWIGMRTAGLDGAHVEYCRGIQNPLGIKVGPSVDPDDLLPLLDVLDPDNEPGRITLIHRLGSDKIDARLPPLLDAVKRSGRTVLWVSDPMHGNTESTKSGYKTRRFERIFTELRRAFEIHRDLGSHLGGVHLELTGDDVTECIGGARGIDEAGLQRAYRSHVDPRLNCEQALELALQIVHLHQEEAGA